MKKKFSNIKNIFCSFLNADIRWKLRKLEKILPFKIYPKKFEFKGLKKIYTLFLFNLIFFEKISKKKKLIFQNIKKNVEEKNKRINFLISTPGSGSTFVRHALSSYFELYYKIGNGIPKYNTLNNSWTFCVSPIVPAGFWNSIDVDRYSIQPSKNKLYFDDNAYQDRKVVFCRHPFGEYANDLYSLKNIKPVVLFREPLDWLSSYYTKYGKKRFDTTGDLNTAFIDDALNKLKNYYMYWIDYSKKNDSKNFLFIKFSKLILEERDTFVKIFDFYGYDCSDLDLIGECVKINSKEYSLNYYKTEYIGSRFMNPEKKKIAKKEIETFAFKRINDLSLDNLYKSLPSID